MEAQGSQNLNKTADHWLQEILRRNYSWEFFFLFYIIWSHLQTLGLQITQYLFIQLALEIQATFGDTQVFALLNKKYTQRYSYSILIYKRFSQREVDIDEKYNFKIRNKEAKQSQKILAVSFFKETVANFTSSVQMLENILSFIRTM